MPLPRLDRLTQPTRPHRTGGGGHVNRVSTKSLAWRELQYEDVGWATIRSVPPKSIIRVEEPGIVQEFEKLVDRWERETATCSSLHEMILHDAYQQIIGLGPNVVPLILERMRAEPNHWFWALQALTRASPADGSETVSEATDAWLTWGRSEGLVS